MLLLVLEYVTIDNGVTALNVFKEFCRIIVLNLG